MRDHRRRRRALRPSTGRGVARRARRRRSPASRRSMLAAEIAESFSRCSSLSSSSECRSSAGTSSPRNGARRLPEMPLATAQSFLSGARPLVALRHLLGERPPPCHRRGHAPPPPRSASVTLPSFGVRRILSYVRQPGAFECLLCESMRPLVAYAGLRQYSHESVRVLGRQMRLPQFIE